MTGEQDQRASKQKTDNDVSRAEILGRVADEFYTLMDRGEKPDVDDYAKRYPEVADAIRRVLPALTLLDESNCDDLVAKFDIGFGDKACDRSFDFGVSEVEIRTR